MWATLLKHRRMETPKLNTADVIFFDEPHEYYKANGTKLEGVTSTIVRWCFPDTYAGIPQDVMDAAAEHGKYVHSCIEVADVIGATEGCTESQQYLDLMAENGMRCIAHEYLVSDGEQLASAIDLVLQDAEGGIWLGDIKTTSELHDAKVRLQLGVYHLLFERMNPHLEVKGTVEVWLPKNGKCAWVVLPMVPLEDVERTISGYFLGADYEAYQCLYDSMRGLPAKYNEMVRAIAANECYMKEARRRNEEMKAALLAAFRENGWKQFKGGGVTITYLKPTTRASVDSKKLKELHPDIYAECEKISEVGDSVRITVKE